MGSCLHKYGGIGPKRTVGRVGVVVVVAQWPRGKKSVIRQQGVSGHAAEGQ